MHKVAFFDVDETLINEKSMFSILSYLSHKLDINASFHLEKIKSMINDGVKREEINKYYYTIYKGISENIFNEHVSSFFGEKIQQDSNFFIHPSIGILEFFRKIDFKIVFISGSSTHILKPVTDYFKPDKVLATEQVIDKEGFFTGEIGSYPIIGRGKSTAILKWAESENIDLNYCIGVGDHTSDSFFLKKVGFQMVLSGDKELERTAQNLNWPVIKRVCDI